jgi:fluoride exporter
MINSLLIFIGAGLGGVLRYNISSLTYWLLQKPFPYGTLVVNVSGCLLMGFLYVVIFERFDGIGPQLRSFFLIGLLGGYTTFSSFSIETLQLFENGAWVGATLNILLSVCLCMFAVWLGTFGGRQL